MKIQFPQLFPQHQRIYEKSAEFLHTVDQEQKENYLYVPFLLMLGRHNKYTNTQALESGSVTITG